MKKLNLRNFSTFSSAVQTVPYLLLLAVLWFKSYTLYFAEADVSLNNVGSSFVAVLGISAVQLLVFLNPFMKNSCAGVVVGAVLSVELVFFLLFAQHYLFLSVLLLLSAAAFSLWLNGRIYSMNKGKRCDTKRLKKWCRDRSNAWAMYALCLVLIVPAAVGAYREYGDISATGAKWSDFSASFYGSEDKTVQYESKIAGLKNWPLLNIKEKEELIRSVALIEKDRLGISRDTEIVVKAEKMPAHTLGYYSDSEKKICINYEHLSKGGLQDLLETVIHEMHHAFVHYTVDGIDFSSELVKESYYFAQARAWAENIDNYIPSEKDYEKYRNQHIEAAAEAYATIRVYMYMDYINGREDFKM